MINKFFIQISKRLNKENDLSDITWAMCNSSTAFRNAFLKFFFPEMDISKNVYIKREAPNEDAASRPDFVINNGGVIYIVENKINDKNHHFGQYDKDFNIPPKRFGYIANYKIFQKNTTSDSSEEYRIKTWEEFYDYLGDLNIEQQNEKQLIIGYSNYIKSVCAIIKFKKAMNINGIYSLYQFNTILKKLCNCDEKEYSISVFHENRCYWDHYIMNGFEGINFNVSFKNVKMKDTYGWIGICFTEVNPLITLGFNAMKGCGKPVYEILDKHKKELKEGRYFCKPYYDDDEGPGYWFDFKESKEFKNERFNKLSINEQESELRSYVNEVISFIIGLCK